MTGVYRTRVGYTGGASANPTYRRMGDHTEAIQIDFDPDQISYEAILWAFFRGHRPTRTAWSRQYRSAIWVHDDAQREVAERVMAAYSAEIGQQIHTAIDNLRPFYLAEDYHQKYSLQSEVKLIRALKKLYPSDFNDVINSTAAARLNGYVCGYGSPESLQKDLPSLGLDEALQTRLTAQVDRFHR